MSSKSATTSKKPVAPKPKEVEEIIPDEEEWSSDSESPDSEDEAFVEEGSMREEEELELAKVLMGFRKRHYLEQGITDVEDK